MVNKRAEESEVRQKSGKIKWRKLPLRKRKGHKAVPGRV